MKNDQYVYKDKVIYNVLIFNEKGNEYNRVNAIKNLKLLAKYYKITLSEKKVKDSLSDTLLDFILGDKGFVETIPNLYNLLK